MVAKVPVDKQWDDAARSGAAAFIESEPDEESKRC